MNLNTQWKPEVTTPHWHGTLFSVRIVRNNFLHDPNILAKLLPTLKEGMGGKDVY